MKVRPGVVILILLMLTLMIFIAFRLLLENAEFYPPRSDFVHPRPFVKLFLEQEGEAKSVENGTLLERAPSGTFRFIIMLSNNSSEPSIRGAFAAGVLIVLRGARVKNYELSEFSGIIGVNEDGDIIDPINSSIVELFVNKLDTWQSAEAKLHIIVENRSDCILIAYRGWIIDEDDTVIEPTSNAREHYIARFPLEEYPDNPPDSRWAGRDFMRYRLHEISLCFNQ